MGVGTPGAQHQVKELTHQPSPPSVSGQSFEEAFLVDGLYS